MSPLAYNSLYLGLDQLRKSVCGEPQFDVELYRQQVKLRNCGKDTDEVVWLFEVLEELSQKERIQYLNFVTGRQRLPSNMF